MQELSWQQERKIYGDIEIGGEENHETVKNRTVLGVLCIAVSLLICFAVTPLVNAGLSQKTTIVRFVKDVKAGEEIKKECCRKSRWEVTTCPKMC